MEPQNANLIVELLINRAFYIITKFELLSSV